MNNEDAEVAVDLPGTYRPVDGTSIRSIAEHGHAIRGVGAGHEHV